jgi:hypothetical protein
MKTDISFLGKTVNIYAVNIHKAIFLRKPSISSAICAAASGGIYV